jgi:hypothetical protein
MLRATCQCGAVELSAESVQPEGVNCYCTICRKISGGAYAPVVCVEPAGFRIVRGTELLSKHNATPEFNRWHCSRCHAPIYGEAPGSKDMPIFVPAGLFEGADIAHVKFNHMFVRSLVPWHRIDGEGLKFETYPG